VLIRGQLCPILGRVTMDQTIVDVTDLETVEVGDQATLVGRQGDGEITITTFSHWAETIPWETLTSVTKRVPRVYRTNLGV
jgi:alanine racemase